MKTKEEYYVYEWNIGRCRCKLCQNKQRKKRYLNSDNVRMWFLQSRANAKNRNVDFTLTWESVQKMWTGRCFETNVVFEMRSNGPNSATMDRIDTADGYHRHNVRIVTRRVNDIRGNRPLVAVMA
jgi:hypothetical protein